MQRQFQLLVNSWWFKCQCLGQGWLGTSSISRYLVAPLQYFPERFLYVKTVMKLLSVQINWSNEIFLTLLNLFLYTLFSCNTDAPVEAAWLEKTTDTHQKPATLTSTTGVTKHRTGFFDLYGVAPLALAQVYTFFNPGLQLSPCATAGHTGTILGEKSMPVGHQFGKAMKGLVGVNWPSSEISEIWDRTSRARARGLLAAENIRWAGELELWTKGMDTSRSFLFLPLSVSGWSKEFLGVSKLSVNMNLELTG